MKFSHKHKIASDANAEAPRSDLNSSQHYVNSPKTAKTDTRTAADALIETDDMSDTRYQKNFRQDTDSIASTEVKIFTEQIHEVVHDENFHVPVDTTNDLSLAQISQNHEDIKQVSMFSLTQAAIRGCICCFFFFEFVSLASTGMQQRAFTLSEHLQHNKYIFTSKTTNTIKYKKIQ